MPRELREGSTTWDDAVNACALFPEFAEAIESAEVVVWDLPFDRELTSNPLAVLCACGMRVPFPATYFDFGSHLESGSALENPLADAAWRMLEGVLCLDSRDEVRVVPFMRARSGSLIPGVYFSIRLDDSSHHVIAGTGDVELDECVAVVTRWRILEVLCALAAVNVRVVPMTLDRPARRRLMRKGGKAANVVVMRPSSGSGWRGTQRRIDAVSAHSVRGCLQHVTRGAFFDAHPEARCWRPTSYGGVLTVWKLGVPRWKSAHFRGGKGEPRTRRFAA